MTELTKAFRTPDKLEGDVATCLQSLQWKYFVKTDYKLLMSQSILCKWPGHLSIT